MRIPVGVSLLLAALLASAGQASAQTCGDSVREAPEQCDDGNVRNLDGCDAVCAFEQTHRVNSLVLQRTVDTTCTANVFGGAFAANVAGNTAYNQVQGGIAQSVTFGATNVLLHPLGLGDLTGTDDPSFEVGVLSGSPVQPGSTPYNGNNDLDWWYLVDRSLINAQREPLNRLTAGVAGSVLTASGTADLKIFLGAGVGTFRVSSLAIGITTGASTIPATSTGLPPGHLAAENLDPTLESFATAGTLASPGTICGNISALSLAQTPIPANLTGGACSQGYTVANSLLDVFVSGCNFGIPVLLARQPDQTDPGAPPAGAGPPYLLSANPTTRVVNGCTASGVAEPDLTACLTDAAYSSYFKFTSDRVISRDDLIFQDGFETVAGLASAAPTDAAAAAGL